MSLKSHKKPSQYDIDQALRDSAPEVIPWQARKPSVKPRPVPAGTKFPRSELDCPTCREPLCFSTDRDGAAVQSCLCGTRFVPVREAPPLRDRQFPRN